MRSMEKLTMKHAQKVAWTFAHTLTPEAEIRGNKLIVPAKYKDQVESFIKAMEADRV